MALQKQPVSINFAKGLDTKTDPFQIALGKFLSLKNSIFDKAGRLTKRNGFGKKTALPDSTTKYLTTFNGNLTAIGTSIQAFSDGSDQWIDKGSIQPIQLSTLPVVRTNTYQSQADSVTASNGLTCVVFTDQVPSGGSLVNTHKYTVIDSTTGQSIVNATALASADATYGTPRVFLLGNYFVILYTTHPAAYHLQYIAVSVTNPTVVTAPVDISTSYIPSTTVNFDAITVNSRLYIAYNTTSGGQSVKVTSLGTSLGSPITPITFAASIATMFTMCADITNSTSPVIYVGFYDLPTTAGYVLAVDSNLNQILAPTQIISSGTYLNLTSTAQSGSVTVFGEVSNAYSYDSGIASNYIDSVNTTQAGVVGSSTVVVRSVGLGSKAFLYNNISYFLGVYSSTFQPSYFLINQSGMVISKLAYSNAGPYLVHGLPNTSLSGSEVKIPYLFKDLIQAANKAQGVTNAAGVYSQLGINLASFDFIPTSVISSEIGGNLNITGGFLGMYDGSTFVEQGFFLYPDDIEVASTTTGSMTAQQYFYQVTYEWADNQGNIFRSAPSIPKTVTLTTGTAVNVNVPTLRLTYKTASPIRITIYRWSAAQQNYYQVTSITTPVQNDITTDSITYKDTLADSSIIGNNLIYTTGGVLENISAPATNVVTLFDNRLWLLNAEDENSFWVSKPVFESTPVELSDLLTVFVAPTTGAQGSTGKATAASPMDDKIIIFKRNSLGYIAGTGPDITGSNNQYTNFIQITSVVGCTNQKSIVITPQGLMFESNKGIWLLGRDLSTTYIGAAVEGLTTGATVLSAVNVPGTNQVRFTLDSGITLMYDYYFGEWGTFVNVPALSSTIYQNLHTYVNASGQVFQETPGIYLDNTSPVLLSFTTGWVNVAGLQGLERVYEILFLGQYLSPFKLTVQLAFDYNSSFTQSTTVMPANATAAWGGENLWGNGGSWGSSQTPSWESSANVFEARVFPIRQKCESFQISVNEVFNPNIGQAAGAGLTLSGLNMVTGMKRGNRTSKASLSFG